MGSFLSLVVEQKENWKYHLSVHPSVLFPNLFKESRLKNPSNVIHLIQYIVLKLVLGAEFDMIALLIYMQ